MRPPAQLDVQHAAAAPPDPLGPDALAAAPLVLVGVDAVYAGDGQQGPQRGLLGRLAGEEVAGRRGQDDAYGQARGRVGGHEGGDDVGDLDGGYGARGCEEEVGLAVFEGGVEFGEGVVACGHFGVRPIVSRSASYGI